MLSGPWGSGKTFFIKKFLQEGNHKHLYVSLYGVSSGSDIDAKLFQQLHPVLSSKGMRLVSLLAKGVLKGALKVDLNADKTDDTLNVSVPDINLRDFANNPTGRLLVFDDLERCSMATADVLGYINAFVEHEGIKAIIVANELEIDAQNERFKNIKEKLIGQTIALRPHVEAAYPELLRSVSDAWAAKFLSDKQSVVLDVFQQSGTENLRVLKQSLWDFERLARCFRQSDKRHEPVMTQILATIVALSIEVRTGRLTIQDLNGLSGNRYARHLSRKGESSPSSLEKAEEKYLPVDLWQTYLAPELITDLLKKGWLEDKAVHASLDRSPPFIPPAQEAEWRRAWHGYERSDAEYEEAMSAVERAFAAREIANLGVLFHVFGLRLQASRNGFLKISERQVVREARRYIDDLRASRRLEFARGHGDAGAVMPDTGYEGLGFCEIGNPNFETIRKYYSNAADKARSEAMPTEAARLREFLRTEPEEFVRSITLTNAGSSLYWRTPILHLIEAATFVDDVLGLAPSDQRNVMYSLEQRYRGNEAESVLAAERSWLRQVLNGFKERAEPLGPMTRDRVRRMRDQLEPLVQRPKRPGKAASPLIPA